jgi:hypothetical protein
VKLVRARALGHHPRRSRSLPHGLPARTYRRTKAGTGRIIAALEAILARYLGERDLANAEE